MYRAWKKGFAYLFGWQQFPLTKLLAYPLCMVMIILSYQRFLRWNWHLPAILSTAVTLISWKWWWQWWLQTPDVTTCLAAHLMITELVTALTLVWAHRWCARCSALSADPRCPAPAHSVMCYILRPEIRSQKTSYISHPFVNVTPDVHNQHSYIFIW